MRKTSSLLIDGGANICLTGDLDILVDVVEIPPLPISVAVNGDAPTLDPSTETLGWLYSLANVLLLQKRGQDHYLPPGNPCL